MATPAPAPHAAVRRARIGALAFWIVPAALLFVLALVGPLFTIDGLGIASWWPAAGVAAWWALRATPRQRVYVFVLVAVITALTNAVWRPMPLPVLYGPINALEVAAITLALRRRDPSFTLHSVKNAFRFLVVVVLASILAGNLVAFVGNVLGQFDYAATAMIVSASHASSILLIAPFALLPPRLPHRAPLVEKIAQSVLLGGAILVAFHPLATLPLGYLVFAVLVWSALRFSPAFVYTQTLVAASIVVAFTLLGSGSFARHGLSPSGLAITLVTFLCTLGIFAVTTVSARHEALATTQRMLDSAAAVAETEREKSATLLQQYELDRQREDFVATLSHELRTPITSIAGYGALLAESDLDETPRTWADAVQRNASRLSLIVDDLLAISPQTGPGAHRPIVVKVDDLVSDAVQVYGRSGDKEITTTVVVPDDLTVFTDRKDALRALGALVSNAVKFTPAGGHISVTAIPVHLDVMITVTDSGSGVPPAALEHAFEPFYRGSYAAALSMAGTGIGLPIARLLARRNGGELALTSPPGEGARATLVLRSGATATSTPAPGEQR